MTCVALLKMELEEVVDAGRPCCLYSAMATHEPMGPLIRFTISSEDLLKTCMPSIANTCQLCRCQGKPGRSKGGKKPSFRWLSISIDACLSQMCTYAFYLIADVHSPVNFSRPISNKLLHKHSTFALEQ